MRELPFFQIDAFAERTFEGNQACVMPLEAWLDDATLQAIGNENNVAETAFLIPDVTGEADYELRWFTPEVEVALCGHATLASGYHVLSRDPARQQVRFRTRKSGVLTVGARRRPADAGPAGVAVRCGRQARVRGGARRNGRVPARDDDRQ